MFLGLRGLRKRFGGRTVIDGFDLEVARGEFVALLGPSGCGKTTVLGLVGGHLAPDAGRVLLDGEDLTDVPPERRPTATVFQSYALFPHLSVAENVAYGLRCRKLPRREAGERAAAMLAALGLAGREAERIDRLSGGEQQRVALARALVLSPKLLLLDEPLSSLDAKLRLRLREEIREVHDRFGLTTILVTHDQEEAMAISDRLAVMDAGRVAQIGSPDAIYRRPATRFVAEFIGTLNLLPGPGGRELALRPESIRLTRDPGALSGRVLRVQFAGARLIYRLEAAGRTIAVEVPAGGAVLAPGEEVGLAFDPADVLPEAAGSVPGAEEGVGPDEGVVVGPGDVEGV